ncbi:putative PI31 proteasome regulator [Rosa chinensis]|uniref:Putative PI31 proteasome regulator n=1 Tax=Rosa chinensis TaxID=74649 RepID=A0A2P6QWV1_ROSCH|nr:putative PI31 proteasome regulator [Rosa chinensis]
MAVIRATHSSFRKENNKVAFAVHASFTASDYELLTSSSTEEVGIEKWNELDNEYAFVHLNSKKVLVKCLVIDGTLSIDALAEGLLRTFTMNSSRVSDYVQENEGSNYSSQFKNLDIYQSLLVRVIWKLVAWVKTLIMMNARFHSHSLWVFWEFSCENGPTKLHSWPRQHLNREN